MEDEVATYEERYRSQPRTLPDLETLARVTSAPEPLRPTNLYTDAAEGRLQDGKGSASTNIRSVSYGSPTLKHRWNKASSPLLDTVSERPEKRPRLAGSHELGPTETFRRDGTSPV
jgi:hypothetical protein